VIINIFFNSFSCFLSLNERIGLERQMGELSLLIDVVSQIDEPFLLAVVVIVC
jgi:hypothetical protein